LSNEYIKASSPLNKGRGRGKRRGKEGREREKGREGIGEGEWG